MLLLLLLFLTLQPGQSQRVSPLLLEDLQAVLPLTLLDHGDEPHDDVERQQDPTRPQQVHREEAEGELVRRSDRRHGDQVPQQQHDRELHPRTRQSSEFRPCTVCAAQSN